GGGDTLTEGNAIAADAKGNVYFAGSTNDVTLATPLAGSLGGSDVIVGRLDPNGGLLGLVLIGGERDDFAYGIALDAANDAYLTGTTLSLHFPTTDRAFQKEKPRSAGVVPNAFVMELDPELAHVVYSTYLGGTTGVSVVVGGVEQTADYGDSGYAIAVDATGAAYVVGRTASEDFPIANAVQQLHAPVPDSAADSNLPPHNDGFVAEIDPSGANLMYSTYLGGTGQDAAVAVAVDGAGNAYVVGTTDSTNFPTTDGSLQPNFIRQPGVPVTSFPDAFWYQTSAFVTRLAPRLQVIAQPVQAFLGQTFTGAVATFTTPDLSASATDFTASVNYGDGITDLNATIVRNGGPGTPFQVSGNHTYTKLGAYPVVVTVTDNKHHESATTAYDA
ncbi:MAG: SBBP repeat-containing protein, partial [Candidatus Saccharimonadales bacterium]